MQGSGSGESQSSRLGLGIYIVKMSLQGDLDVLEILRATVLGSWLSSKIEGLMGQNCSSEGGTQSSSSSTASGSLWEMQYHSHLPGCASQNLHFNNNARDLNASESLRNTGLNQCTVHDNKA